MTKFEKILVHFKSDFFTAVAIVDAKTPYYNHDRGAIFIFFINLL